MWVRSMFNRKRYAGALSFNLVAFMLPALYGTLSKLWIASIDSSMIATTDAYTYIGVITEILNEGLPRAAWLIIGDAEQRSLVERVRLADTLICFQASIGALLSIIVLAASRKFSQSFVPASVADVSATYVRISAFSALASALEASVANSTRALDMPDVPLIISLVKFAVNIVLDLVFISRFHVRVVTPTVNTQAATRLACDLAASLAGLLYYLLVTAKLLGQSQTKLQKDGHDEENEDGEESEEEDNIEQRLMKPTVEGNRDDDDGDGDGDSDEAADHRRPTLKALLVLVRPGIPTFLESLVRNALYLWVIHTVIALGLTYATAWSVFTAIRWGLVMVPVQALEATSLAFTGHRWGRWRASLDPEGDGTRWHATWWDLRDITKPAVTSFFIALAIEAVLCGAMSAGGAYSFAMYLTDDSTEVASVAAMMWRTIDWCYIFYATSTQAATILLATSPRWYLYQSLTSNFLWVLPLAIAFQVKALDVNHAWKWHALNFGGSLVFSWVIVAMFLWMWASKMRGGTLKLKKIHQT